MSKSHQEILVEANLVLMEIDYFLELLKKVKPKNDKELTNYRKADLELRVLMTGVLTERDSIKKDSNPEELHAKEKVLEGANRDLKKLVALAKLETLIPVISSEKPEKKENFNESKFDESKYLALRLSSRVQIAASAYLKKHPKRALLHSHQNQANRLIEYAEQLEREFKRETLDTPNRRKFLINEMTAFTLEVNRIERSLGEKGELYQLLEDNTVGINAVRARLEVLGEEERKLSPSEKEDNQFSVLEQQAIGLANAILEIASNYAKYERGHGLFKHIHFTQAAKLKELSENICSHNHTTPDKREEFLENTAALIKQVEVIEKSIKKGTLHSALHGKGSLLSNNKGSPMAKIESMKPLIEEHLVKHHARKI